ncbi:MAG: thiamine pyrophosphate-dependent enzyme, partial [Planctomycetota bacterium]
LLSEAAFQTYCRDGSVLGAHPEHTLQGVDLSTGSLGLSLSVGCGLAYAFRVKHSPARVYVLVSDAECNEGQVWEAAMFAAHHNLSALTVALDLNGSQAMGQTSEILRIAQRPLWEALGWQVVESDGHDAAALCSAFQAASVPPRPKVVLAKTVLGKGVSFMENRFEWHYRNLTPEQAAAALRELGQSSAGF